MAPKPCVPSSGRFFIRTITTVTVQNLHDSDDLDLLAARVTERVELESRVLVLRADAGRTLGGLDQLPGTGRHAAGGTVARQAGGGLPLR